MFYPFNISKNALMWSFLLFVSLPRGLHSPITITFFTDVGKFTVTRSLWLSSWSLSKGVVSASPWPVFLCSVGVSVQHYDFPFFLALSSLLFIFLFDYSFCKMLHSFTTGRQGNNILHALLSTHWIKNRQWSVTNRFRKKCHDWSRS